MKRQRPASAEAAPTARDSLHSITQHAKLPGRNVVDHHEENLALFRSWFMDQYAQMSLEPEASEAPSSSSVDSSSDGAGSEIGAEKARRARHNMYARFMLASEVAVAAGNGSHGAEALLVGESGAAATAALADAAGAVARRQLARDVNSTATAQASAAAGAAAGRSDADRFRDFLVHVRSLRRSTRERQLASALASITPPQADSRMQVLADMRRRVHFHRAIRAAGQYAAQLSLSSAPEAASTGQVAQGTDHMNASQVDPRAFVWDFAAEGGGARQKRGGHAVPASQTHTSASGAQEDLSGSESETASLGKHNAADTFAFHIQYQLAKQSAARQAAEAAGILGKTHDPYDPAFRLQLGAGPGDEEGEVPGRGVGVRSVDERLTPLAARLLGLPPPMGTSELLRRRLRVMALAASRTGNAGAPTPVDTVDAYGADSGAEDAQQRSLRGLYKRAINDRAALDASLEGSPPRADTAADLLPSFAAEMLPPVGSNQYPGLGESKTDSQFLADPLARLLRQGNLSDTVRSTLEAFFSDPRSVPLGMYNSAMMEGLVRSLGRYVFNPEGPSRLMQHADGEVPVPQPSRAGGRKRHNTLSSMSESTLMAMLEDKQGVQTDTPLSESPQLEEQTAQLSPPAAGTASAASLVSRVSSPGHERTRSVSQIPPQADSTSRLSVSTSHAPALDMSPPSHGSLHLELPGQSTGQSPTRIMGFALQRDVSLRELLETPSVRELRKQLDTFPPQLHAAATRPWSQFANSWEDISMQGLVAAAQRGAENAQEGGLAAVCSTASLHLQSTLLDAVLERRARLEGTRAARRHARLLWLLVERHNKLVEALIRTRETALFRRWRRVAVHAAGTAHTLALARAAALRKRHGWGVLAAVRTATERLRVQQGVGLPGGPPTGQPGHIMLAMGPQGRILPLEELAAQAAEAAGAIKSRVNADGILVDRSIPGWDRKQAGKPAGDRNIPGVHDMFLPSGYITRDPSLFGSVVVSAAQLSNTATLKSTLSSHLGGVSDDAAPPQKAWAGQLDLTLMAAANTMNSALYALLLQNYTQQTVNGAPVAAGAAVASGGGQGASPVQGGSFFEEGVGTWPPESRHLLSPFALGNIGQPVGSIMSPQKAKKKAKSPRDSLQAGSPPQQEQPAAEGGKRQRMQGHVLGYNPGHSESGNLLTADFYMDAWGEVWAGQLLQVPGSRNTETWRVIKLNVGDGNKNAPKYKSSHLRAIRDRISFRDGDPIGDVYLLAGVGGVEDGVVALRQAMREAADRAVTAMMGMHVPGCAGTAPLRDVDTNGLNLSKVVIAGIRAGKIPPVGHALHPFHAQIFERGLVSNNDDFVDDWGFKLLNSLRAGLDMELDAAGNIVPKAADTGRRPPGNAQAVSSSAPSGTADDFLPPLEDIHEGVFSDMQRHLASLFDSEHRAAKRAERKAARPARTKTVATSPTGDGSKPPRSPKASAAASPEARQVGRAASPSSHSRRAQTATQAQDPGASTGLNYVGWGSDSDSPQSVSLHRREGSFMSSGGSSAHSGGEEDDSDSGEDTFSESGISRGGLSRHTRGGSTASFSSAFGSGSAIGGLPGLMELISIHSFRARPMPPAISARVSANSALADAWLMADSGYGPYAMKRARAREAKADAEVMQRTVTAVSGGGAAGSETAGPARVTPTVATLLGVEEDLEGVDLTPPDSLLWDIRPEAAARREQLLAVASLTWGMDANSDSEDGLARADLEAAAAAHIESERIAAEMMAPDRMVRRADRHNAVTSPMRAPEDNDAPLSPQLGGAPPAPRHSDLAGDSLSSVFGFDTEDTLTHTPPLPAQEGGTLEERRVLEALQGEPSRLAPLLVPRPVYNARGIPAPRKAASPPSSGTSGGVALKWSPSSWLKQDVQRVVQRARSSMKSRRSRSVSPRSSKRSSSAGRKGVKGLAQQRKASSRSMWRPSSARSMRSMGSHRMSQRRQSTQMTPVQQEEAVAWMRQWLDIASAGLKGVKGASVLPADAHHRMQGGGGAIDITVMHPELLQRLGMSKYVEALKAQGVKFQPKPPPIALRGGVYEPAMQAEDGFLDLDVDDQVADMADVPADDLTVTAALPVHVDSGHTSPHRADLSRDVSLAYSSASEASLANPHAGVLGRHRDPLALDWLAAEHIEAHDGAGGVTHFSGVGGGVHGDDGDNDGDQHYKAAPRLSVSSSDSGKFYVHDAESHAGPSSKGLEGPAASDSMQLPIVARRLVPAWAQQEGPPSLLRTASAPPSSLQRYRWALSRELHMYDDPMQGPVAEPAVGSGTAAQRVHTAGSAAAAVELPAGTSALLPQRLTEDEELGILQDDGSTISGMDAVMHADVAPWPVSPMSWTPQRLGGDPPLLGLPRAAGSTQQGRQFSFADLPVLVTVRATSNLHRDLPGSAEARSSLQPSRPRTAHVAGTGTFLDPPSGHVHAVLPIKGRGHTTWVVRGHGPRVLHEAHVLRRLHAFHSASSPDVLLGTHSRDGVATAATHAGQTPLGIDLQNVLSAVFAAPMVTTGSFRPPSTQEHQRAGGLNVAAHFTGGGQEGGVDAVLQAGVATVGGDSDGVFPSQRHLEDGEDALSLGGPGEDEDTLDLTSRDLRRAGVNDSRALASILLANAVQQVQDRHTLLSSSAKSRGVKISGGDHKGAARLQHELQRMAKKDSENAQLPALAPVLSHAQWAWLPVELQRRHLLLAIAGLQTHPSLALAPAVPPVPRGAAAADESDQNGVPVDLEAPAPPLGGWDGGSIGALSSVSPSSAHQGGEALEAASASSLPPASPGSETSAAVTFPESSAAGAGVDAPPFGKEDAEPPQTPMAVLLRRALVQQTVARETLLLRLRVYLRGVHNIEWHYLHYVSFHEQNTHLREAVLCGTPMDEHGNVVPHGSIIEHARGILDAQENEQGAVSSSRQGGSEFTARKGLLSEKMYAAAHPVLSRLFSQVAESGKAVLALVSLARQSALQEADAAQQGVSGGATRSLAAASSAVALSLLPPTDAAERLVAFAEASAEPWFATEPYVGKLARDVTDVCYVSDTERLLRRQRGTTHTGYGSAPLTPADDLAVLQTGHTAHQLGSFLQSVGLGGGLTETWGGAKDAPHGTLGASQMSVPQPRRDALRPALVAGGEGGGDMHLDVTASPGREVPAQEGDDSDVMWLSPSRDDGRAMVRPLLTMYGPMPPAGAEGFSVATARGAARAAGLTSPVRGGFSDVKRMVYQRRSQAQLDVVRRPGQQETAGEASNPPPQMLPRPPPMPSKSSFSTQSTAPVHVFQHRDRRMAVEVEQAAKGTEGGSKTDADPPRPQSARPSMSSDAAAGTRPHTASESSMLDVTEQVPNSVFDMPLWAPQKTRSGGGAISRTVRPSSAGARIGGLQPTPPPQPKFVVATRSTLERLRSTGGGSAANEGGHDLPPRAPSAGQRSQHSRPKTASKPVKLELPPQGKLELPQGSGQLAEGGSVASEGARLLQSARWAARRAKLGKGPEGGLKNKPQRKSVRKQQQLPSHGFGSSEGRVQGVEGGGEAGDDGMRAQLADLGFSSSVADLLLQPDLEDLQPDAQGGDVASSDPLQHACPTTSQTSSGPLAPPRPSAAAAPSSAAQRAAGEMTSLALMGPKRSRRGQNGHIRAGTDQATRDPLALVKGGGRQPKAGKRRLRGIASALTALVDTT